MANGQCQGLFSSGFPVIKKLRPHPHSPNSSQQISTIEIFFALFEVEEILQQGQQQRLDVGSLQEFLGIKKHRFVEASLGRPVFFPVCDR